MILSMNEHRLIGRKSLGAVCDFFPGFRNKYTYIHIWHKHPKSGKAYDVFLSCGALKQEQTYTTLFHDQLILP